MSHRKLYLMWGILLPSLFVIRAGEYIVDYVWGDNDGKITTPEISFVLSLLYKISILFLLLLGVLYIIDLLSSRYSLVKRPVEFLIHNVKRFFRMRLIQNIFLTGSSLFLFLIIFEVILQTGWFDDLDNPHPIWIPRKYRLEDARIGGENLRFSQKNLYKFTDIERTVFKPPGVYRIAILGDSFIWGDGLPYELTWSHKLERKIITQYNNIEVLSWGYCGWSTQNEFQFFKEHGIEYELDLLIVGFVTNDLDLGTYPQKHLRWQNSEFLTIFKRLFPNVVDFISAYINTFLIEFIFEDYGYEHWENVLYSDENLHHYLLLLQDFSNYCTQQKIPLLFVLTPSNYSKRFKKLYDLIIPLLEEAEIEYLDLYPAVVEKLYSYNIRELWANPANGHPGNLVTEVYADEVFHYLQMHMFSNFECFQREK